ncbi:MAG: 2-amino-4-hydroxy-6-hydroxymethyldihydropteridine diphosphokinase [Desulfobacterales bacterium]|nr:2-amino-4-hydroxy-6-hydroxymethyldihydropteridine diphosphokinase [Desulfobacterales bacterium]
MNIQSSHVNTAYISIGSNMGDKRENCQNALAALDRTETVQIESISRFYFTEPMEYSDQPWFVNAAAQIRTSLDPVDFLTVLKSFEVEYGREDSGVRFGPRPLDLDIIFYNDSIIETAQLIVPHPRMHHREFVLRPISDLAPGLIHPVFKKSVRQLFEELSDESQQCILMEEMFT